MMIRMDLACARQFASRWQDDWNSHDLDRVLAHYAEDVVFSSPMIARLTGDPAGTPHGKAALRAYWTTGPIDYRDQIGGRVYEVLAFRDVLIVSGFGAYGETAAV